MSRLRGAVESLDGLNEMFGPVGPKLAAGNMHAWVGEASSDLWDDGHWKAAVSKASTRIEVEVRSLLGREDMKFTPLVQMAFSKDEPKPNQPRLRFDYPIGDSWTNAHVGALQFGQGCVMRIRNLLAHENDEPDEHEALEALTSLSLLARWITSAELVEANPS